MWPVGTGIQLVETHETILGGKHGIQTDNLIPLEGIYAADEGLALSPVVVSCFSVISGNQLPRLCHRIAA